MKGQIENKSFDLELFLVQYQNKINVIQPSNDLNPIIDPFKSNENKNELGLFKHFNISQKTVKRLKGIYLYFLNHIWIK